MKNLTKYFTLLLFSFLSFKLVGQETDIILTINTNGTKLTKNENSDSEVLITLAKGDKVKFLEIVFPFGHSSERFKVSYNSMIGYVSSYFINPDANINNQILKFSEFRKDIQKKEEERKKFLYDSITNIKIKQNEENLKIAKINEENEIRKNDSIADAMLNSAKIDSKERRLRYIKKFGQTNAEKIINGLIWIGMTEEMLIESWGNPIDINRTVTANKVHKQFVYSNYKYVYTDNGIVTAIQD